MAEEKNDAIKKAKEVLENISNDEKERYIAELREKYILETNSYIATGYDAGIKDGIEQKSKEIAKKMLQKNMDLNSISEITGLSIKEIQDLK